MRWRAGRSEPETGMGELFDWIFAFLSEKVQIGCMALLVLAILGVVLVVWLNR